MTAWKPISSMPADVEVRIRWADGETAIAARLSPAPIEIDPDQQWWWGVDALSYSSGGCWTDERKEHQPEDAIEWQELPESGPVEPPL